MKTYRCQFCRFTATVNKTQKGVKSAKYRMGHHYETVHKELIPPGFTGFRWFYFLLTKKDRGTCVECKRETEFNEETMKYCRYCPDPKCKEKYKAERDRRMIQTYGRIYLTDDPEFQKKMLEARKISGQYLWKDGTRVGYTGSYEQHFLQYLNTEKNWPSSDIVGPSPHVYAYEYDGKLHFYIPDYFIPSISCEIEIKDDGSAKNISQESREKDIAKDALMKSNSGLFNYIKIVNKNYGQFEELIKEE